MAINWIKMETSTPDKPEIFHLMRILTKKQSDVFLLCFRFWSWCDANIKDGKCPHFVREELDSIVQCDGFADALETVGWVTFREDLMVVKNYEKHLANTAKNRAKDAKRKAIERKNGPF